MARKCDCCRNCGILVPSKPADSADLMPHAERLRELPFGTLTDAAGVYDEEGEELTSAVAFVWWLKTTALHKSGIMPSGRVLTAADRRW